MRNRRETLRAGIGLCGAVSALICSGGQYARAASPADSTASFISQLSELKTTPSLITSASGYHEFAELFPDLNLEHAPSRARPSKLEISVRAKDLITFCEISSQQHYEASLTRPVWPGRASGVTIGVGYDLGYVTPELFQADWTEYLKSLPDDAKRRMANVCTKKAQDAEAIASSVRDIVIPWETAEAEFLQVEIPKYVGLTQESLPNFAALSPDCRGALVSLVYNRGASFSVPPSRDAEGRYDEMRNIRELMVVKDFGGISSEIRKMIRLWVDKPDMRGLVKRRQLEATLFDIGYQGG